MRIAAAAGAMLFAALVALFTIINAQDISQEELARRCNTSSPAWNGYQEDIKAIGARSVAKWRGEPVAAEATSDGVRVSMALQPPWDEWPAALPLLLKDPLGETHRNVEAVKKDGLRVYLFPPIPGTGQSPPPWVELQYPHTKQRLHLNAGGKWRAAGASPE